MKRYRGSLSQISPPVSAPSLDFSSSDSAANLVAFLLFSIVRRVRRANVTANARSRQLEIMCKDIGGENRLEGKTYAADMACPLRNLSSESKYICGEALQW